MYLIRPTYLISYSQCWADVSPVIIIRYTLRSGITQSSRYLYLNLPIDRLTVSGGWFCVLRIKRSPSLSHSFAFSLSLARFEAPSTACDAKFHRLGKK